MVISLTILVSVTGAAVIQMRHSSNHRELLSTAQSVRETLYVARNFALAPPIDKSPRVNTFRVSWGNPSTGNQQLMVQEVVRPASGSQTPETFAQTLYQLRIPAKFVLRSQAPDGGGAVDFSIDAISQGSATSALTADGKVALALQVANDPAQAVEITLYALTGQVVMCDRTLTDPGPATCTSTP